MSDETPLTRLGAARERGDGGFLWETIVNGPVRSRRLGTSLGVNILPARSKLCGFNCSYCECGFNTPKAQGSRWPSPDEIAHSLRRALDRLPQAPDAITLSGNGEPTLHPRFSIVVERILEVRGDLAPRSRTVVLSNGLAAGVPAVAGALMRLDARMLKLDPGPRQRVNGLEYDADRRASDYRALKPYTVQAMVAKGTDWDGSSAASVAEWLQLVVRADPDAVHLYSLARPPADFGVQNVPRERLEEMAIALRTALPRCVVDVF
jgi:wyosine [tRNA(Phe)-imidazoG37] synthetase (radical SAM superfamily)